MESPAPAGSAPEAAAGRPRTRPSRRVLYSALAGVVSLVVIGVMAAFVLIPAEPSVQLAVTELATTPPVDDEIAAEMDPSDEAESMVIYGGVEVRGVPATDITVTLAGATSETEGEKAVIRVDEPGTFRSVVQLKPGRYEVRVAMKIGQDPFEIVTERVLEGDKNYGLQIQISEGGIVTFFPISVY